MIESKEFIIGKSKVNTDKYFGYEFIIRPDVEEIAIFSLLESFFLSFGVKINTSKNNGENKISVLTSFEGNSDITLTASIGNNEQLMRVIFLHLSLPTGASNKKINEYLKNIAEQLSTALSTEYYTISAITNTYHSYFKRLRLNDRKSDFVLLLTHSINEFYDSFDDISLPSELVSCINNDTLIDINYVKDLQYSYAQKLDIQYDARITQLSSQIK